MQTELKETTGRAREFARILDSAFRVPGTRYRFGLDPVFGLIPGLGDAIGGGFGAYLLVLAFRKGAPPIVMLRMFGNIAADLLLGAIPLLGDLFDAGYKANLRNLSLLERFLDRPQETTRESRALFIILVTLLVVILGGATWLAIAAIEAALRAIT
jgi:hypothetical protein